MSLHFDNWGTAIITGSTMKVIELVASHLVNGWDPEGNSGCCVEFFNAIV